MKYVDFVSYLYFTIQDVLGMQLSQKDNDSFHENLCVKPHHSWRM